MNRIRSILTVLFFSHTDVGTQGNNLVSWSAPLLYSVLVGSVLIKNRYCQNPSDPNGCLCRLSSATISLADENGNIFAYQELGNTCGQLEIEVNEFIPYETNGNETSSNVSAKPEVEWYNHICIHLCFNRLGNYLSSQSQHLLPDLATLLPVRSSCNPSLACLLLCLRLKSCHLDRM